MTTHKRPWGDLFAIWFYIALFNLVLVLITEDRFSYVIAGSAGLSWLLWLIFRR